MRKSLGAWVVLLLSFALSALAAPSSHLLALKSKFPFGLLGEDYGILKANDLALNACRFKPEAFPPPSFTHPYQYWQCFETKTISLHCERDGVIQDSHEGPMGLVVVRASIAGIQHHYIAPRPWPLRDCRDYFKDIKTLMNGTEHACISGSFIDDETDKNRQRTVSWTLDRFKTSKGCDGHHDCAFNKKFQQENCPDMNIE